MTEERKCPQCGSSIPADAPAGGICPRCLMRQGLESQVSTRTGGGRRVAPPSPASLAPKFPQLEILELIGAGGMGAVYRAVQKKLDREVALKILTSEAAHGPAFAERFAREARTLAKVNHPNIVGIHDFGEADDLYYFVMEFVDGANLRQVLREGELSAGEALRIVPQVCDALQYAHEEGVVHRDIKPENILLDRKGRVKIADFGLAKLIQRAPLDYTLTVPGEVMGTPAYMAPEQIEKPTQVDHRADIFSLGVVFYEMLTGELPLGRFAPPSHKVQVDVRLDEVVLRTLAKEPELRYQHASEIKSDVQIIDEDSGGRAAGAPSSTTAAPAVAGGGSAGTAVPPAAAISPGGASPPAAAAVPETTTPPPTGSRTVTIRRPRGVTWTAIYCFFLAALNLGSPSVVGGAGTLWWNWFRFMSLAFLIWAIFTGIGLLRLRSWARPSAIILAALGLVFFPVGTILSIFVLTYISKRDVGRLFELGDGPVTLTETEARKMEWTMGKKAKAS